MEKSYTLKPNGRKQRENIALTLEVANALVEIVQSGQSLYPKGGLVIKLNTGDGEEKPLKIGKGTLNSWITRDNVIPETGEVLREVLRRAREQYRVNKKQETHFAMVQKAESEYRRVLQLRTNIPIRNQLGQALTREDGSYIRKESAALLRIKLNAAKFVMEKLEPETYGKKEPKPEPKQFNLAELRKYKMQQKKVS